MRLLIYTFSWKSRLIHSPFSIIVCHSSIRNNRRSALFDRTLRLWKQNLYYFQLHFSYFIAEFFPSAIKEDKKLSVWKKECVTTKWKYKKYRFRKAAKKMAQYILCKIATFLYFTKQKSAWNNFPLYNYN